LELFVAPKCAAVAIEWGGGFIGDAAIIPGDTCVEGTPAPSAGFRAAACCGASNIASRQTLQQAGFLPCGRLLVGEVLSSA